VSEELSEVDESKRHSINANESVQDNEIKSQQIEIKVYKPDDLVVVKTEPTIH
jgi:hypothetical protein